MSKVFKGLYQSLQYDSIICNLNHNFVKSIMIRYYLEENYYYDYFIIFIYLGPLIIH